MKYIHKILFVVFVCCLVAIFVLSPLLFYSFPYISSQYFGQFSSLFTTNELSHLQDVTAIFNIIYLIEIIALLGFSSILLLFSYLKFKKKIVLGFLLGSVFSLFLLLGVIIAIFIDFESLFTSFHYVFFPQGNRSFDGSSALIQLFPIEFFETIAMKIFLTSIGCSLLGFGGSLLYFYKKR
ncbi:MAG: DUF1461 domain-containing protein [Candidatus Absconditabacteria bacterium]|nr:DUF1461 domain-containing protein [Candidatus Absconditabacteria bacterium]